MNTLFTECASFLSFNRSFIGGWIFVKTVFLIVFFISIRHVESKNRILRSFFPFSPVGYAVFYFGLLLIQMPLFMRGFLHIDETQHLAAVAVLARDFRFWLSVDGTTAGPLVLALPAILIKAGLGDGYPMMRILNMTLWYGSLGLLYRTFRFYFSPVRSALMSFPLLALITCFYQVDYITYNSETATCFLLLAGFLSAVMAMKEETGRLGPFFAGFFLCLAPLAKIQSGPIVLGLALALLLAEGDRRRRFLLFLAGALLPVGLLIVYLVRCNAGHDFWQSYIVNNLFYAQGGVGLNVRRGFVLNLFKIPFTLLRNVETRLVFAVSFIMLLDYVRRRFGGPVQGFSGNVTVREFRLAIIFLATSLLVVMLPGNIFAHYSLFLVLPCLLVTGLLVDTWSSRMVPGWLVPVFVLLMAVMPAANTIFHYNLEFETQDYRKTERRPDLVARIENLNLENGSMAVWGWAPDLNVRSGLLMGTREPHTQRQIFAVRQKEYYLSRYIKDLDRRRPELFVDATALDPWVFDPHRDHFRNFPSIAEYINRHYVLLDSIEGVELFIRK